MGFRIGDLVESTVESPLLSFKRRYIVREVQKSTGKIMINTIHLWHNSSNFILIKRKEKEMKIMKSKITLEVTTALSIGELEIMMNSLLKTREDRMTVDSFAIEAMKTKREIYIDSDELEKTKLLIDEILEDKFEVIENEDFKEYMDLAVVIDTVYGRETIWNANTVKSFGPYKKGSILPNGIENFVEDIERNSNEDIKMLIARATNARAKLRERMRGMEGKETVIGLSPSELKLIREQREGK